MASTSAVSINIFSPHILVPKCILFINFADILSTGMKATAVFFILHLCVSYGYGQNSILFTIGKNQILVDEFAYTFAKNNNGSSTKDEIDEYLTLYINFKLKYLDTGFFYLD